MGLTPEFWGPHVWAAIHLICLGAPDKFNSSDSAAYRIFFENLPNILPCEVCKNHLIDNLKAVPLDTALASGRDALFAWSVKLHNQVNAMLGKPIVNYEDALAFWMSVARGAPISSKKQHASRGCIHIIVLMGIMLIIGILLGIYLKGV
jgi:hypothetical protein